MIIAIDADGVLTDMNSFCVKYGERFLKRKPVKPTAYSMEEMFNATAVEYLIYGLRVFSKYCKECPPREGTQKVIRQLNQDGHVLYEVTARKFVTMKNPLGMYSRKMLLSWYEKHGLHFKEICFCSEKNTGDEKVASCKKIGAKIMIEDRPEVAYCLAENGITVLLFDAPYNKEVMGEGIVRVHSWKEVYEWVRRHSE